MKKLLSRPKISNLTGKILGKKRVLAPFRHFIHRVQVKRIVFVCLGNICRSPFAEYVAKEKLSKKYEIISRGLHAAAGGPADSSASRIAKEYGIDLKEHIAGLFSPIEILPNDLIVVMEQSHLSELNSRLKKQAVLLGAFTIDEGFPLTIQDPWGHDDDVFRKCFSQIELAVGNLGEELKSER